MKLVRLLFILIIGWGVYASAAPQSWRVFSPPNKRLTIELPVSPNTITQEDERLPTIFPGTTTADFYSVDLIPGGHRELFFGVINLSRRLTNRRFDETVNSNMLWIAGDDKHFSKRTDHTVASLHGREFVFTKGMMSGRALYLNGGRSVYLIAYSTENGDTPAATVDRIFNSFRPLPDR